MDESSYAISAARTSAARTSSATRRDSVSIPQLRLLTRTSQIDPNLAGPACSRQHPRPHLPGRSVPHMLAVSALELGHPMPLRVLVKTSYSAHFESIIVKRGL